MSVLQRVQFILDVVLGRIASRLRATASTAIRQERGDVPGWVLIAVMSAGLVILIWTLAGPLLSQVFEDAVSRVSGNL